MTVPELRDYQAVAMRRSGQAADDAALADQVAVTVVTVTLNAAATLERTIASVQAQSLLGLAHGIEHVVVDGGSTDGTTALLAARLRPQDFWISEPDRGISDAFNKGVALARGRYIQILNADDWLSPGQIARTLATLEREDADFVFGDLIFYEQGRPSFRYRGTPDYPCRIGKRMPALNHPTVLAHRRAFERIGLFDLRYRCAMDYDWFLRLHRAGRRGVYDPEIVGHMAHDGVSNTAFQRTIREVRDIAIAYGRAPLFAHGEAVFQIAKTSASHYVKRWAQPLYHLVRRTINSSYAPLE